MTTGGHPPPAYFSHKRRSLVLTVPFAAIRPRGFMSKNNDGGYAFPMEATDATAWRDCNQGMTLRDYFAAKAMQGRLANPDWLCSDDRTATEAYQIADAMLRARGAS